jgi:hypothetical protein
LGSRGDDCRHSYFQIRSRLRLRQAPLGSNAFTAGDKTLPKMMSKNKPKIIDGGVVTGMNGGFRPLLDPKRCSLVVTKSCSSGTITGTIKCWDLPVKDTALRRCTQLVGFGGSRSISTLCPLPLDCPINDAALNSTGWFWWIFSGIWVEYL